MKKPSRRASAETWTQYNQARKVHNLSQHVVQMAHALRHALDAAGGVGKTLVLAGDGSFYNRTCMRAIPDRIELIVRARQDAVLCHQAPAGTRRFYDPTTLTPDQGRHDETRPWHVTEVCYSGQRRTIRYTEGPAVPWCLDLITLLRKEMVEHPELLQEFDVSLTDRGLTSSAAA